MKWWMYFFIVLILAAGSPACAFPGGHMGENVEQEIGNDIDENALNNVMQMILDLGGQDNIKKNSGKTFSCTYRGNRKISVVKKGTETTYKGVYQNCRDKGMTRDGIFEIVVSDGVIEQTSTRRSINGELIDTLFAGNLKKAKKLIKAKADVNYTESLRMSDGSAIGEWTPLMVAVMTRNLDAVKLLVSSGAWVNYMNSQAFNALWLAADVDRPDIVSYLIAHGANVNNSNFENITPLMNAAMNGNYDIAAQLIASHAELNRTHKDGDTALMFAIARGHNRVANLLIDSGSDIQHQNKFGTSALMIAASEGNEEIVRKLLEHKALVTAKSDAGKTALDAAVSKGHTVIVELLKKATR